MHTTNRIGIPGLLLLILCQSFFALGQKDVEKEYNESNVRFYGEWKKSKKCKKDSPLMLAITVQNNGTKSIETTFKIMFFDTGMAAEESEPITLCIEPNKKKKGRKYGLCIVSEQFSNEQIQNASFTWEIDDIEVKELDAERLNCTD